MPRVVTSGAKRASQYVTVACKLPQGMVIPVQGLQHPIKLHGQHSPFAQFGYGMTEVKADVWEQILKQYGEKEGVNRQGEKCIIPQAAWLANRVVFAHADTKSTTSEAKEREKHRVGFEAVNPRDKADPNFASGKIQNEGADDPGQPGLD